MNPNDLTSIVVLLFIAIIIVWYEMIESLKPQYRKGCGECARARREAAETEKRRQEQLAREYDESLRRHSPPGAGTKGESQDKPRKGGWMV